MLYEMIEQQMEETDEMVNFYRELAWGPSIYDARKILGFFDPLPPLSAFGTDLQY